MTGADTALIITAIGTLLTAMASSAAVFIGAMNSRKLTAAQADVRKIELATNSMKDALVAATGKAAHAEGKAEGKAEGRAESVAEQKAEPPAAMPVEVIASVPITIKSDKK